jgi:hypothetical protein
MRPIEQCAERQVDSFGGKIPQCNIDRRGASEKILPDPAKPAAWMRRWRTTSI